MEVHIGEALKAKEIAERKFAEKDFVGAKNYALKAQKMCPDLEGIAQMVLTFGVHSAAQMKINGEVDLYAVLGLDSSADKSSVKKQYKKMAVMLHPDKNKTVGADSAFKLVSEARAVLSDNARRMSYDYKRNTNCLNKLDTFWTVCSNCDVQYEYFRKYENKKLSCKNCRAVFTAYETGLGPADSVYPYYSWASKRENGHNFGHGSGYASNLSFQWVPGNSFGVTVPQREKMKGTEQRDHLKQGARRGRPPKIRKVEFEGNHINNIHNCNRSSQTAAMEVGIANGNTNPKHSKFCSGFEAASKRSIAPAFDSRQLLIDKARTVIHKKLEVMKVVEEKKKPLGECGEDSNKRPKRPQSQLRRTGSMTITVPDSDFHDFDKDKTEESFKPRQIWALYDEEDGMPRLYCLVRQVLSLNPFKIHISYLSSKSDSEFGTVNWLISGFTKSCGHFRAFNSEIVDQVNLFSHLLSGEKAGRGGCVRIFPKRGDVWAVYRNWSPDWNRTTPDEVRHQYEMVEVLDDYSEETGVSVAPLLKVDGYKTVYKRNSDKDAIRWIQRREMLCFSHMVPSFFLKGDEGGTPTKPMPEGCWDLDPAAIPDVLQSANEHELPESKMDLCPETELCGPMNSAMPDMSQGISDQKVIVEEEDRFRPANEVAWFMTDVHNREKHCQTDHMSSTPCPGEHLRAVTNA
ncbi:unnamed protein product [Cuscuta campestris]|uniref:J domain-containing protein n=1 Tax=Cuscuta campestris TaxID=132261 RepID=A0A484MN42_9ASTE|nr:unnamed protein product [Cuscuta campestris]